MLRAQLHNLEDACDDARTNGDFTGVMRRAADNSSMRRYARNHNLA